MVGKYAIMVVVLFVVTSSFAPSTRSAPLQDTQTCATIPTGLVSWWTGNETVKDRIGSNNGKLKNGVLYAKGKVKQAFSFDGVNDFVIIGNRPSLALTNGLTIEGWVKPLRLGEGSWASILTKWGQSSETDSYLLAMHKSNGIMQLVGGIGVLNSSDSGFKGGELERNKWSHVAMTYDAGTGQNVLYVNGANVASRTRIGGINTSNLRVLIGKEDSPMPRFFPGVIDELSIYNRALTEQEVQSIYAAGSAGKCKP